MAANSATSLRDFDRIADRIRLHRQADTRPVIVVEGPSDDRFCKRVLPKNAVVIFVAGTRSVVIATAVDVSAYKLEQVACVVDRDFDDVVEEAESRGLPVVAYDGADLEAMLVESEAFEDMLGELGSPEKLEKFGGANAVRGAIQEAILPYQRIRRANSLLRWGINFDDFDIASRVDVRTLRLGVQATCDMIWSKAHGVVSKEDLYAATQIEDKRCPSTGILLIRGRDFLSVTGVALRRLIGNLRQQDANGNQLATNLRMASSSESVMSTAWRRSLGKALDI